MATTHIYKIFTRYKQDMVIVKNSLVSKTERGGNKPSGLAMRDNHHGSARKLTEAHGSPRKARFGLVKGLVHGSARKRTEGSHGRSGLVY